MEDISHYIGLHFWLLITNSIYILGMVGFKYFHLARNVALVSILLAWASHQVSKDCDNAPFN